MKPTFDSTSDIAPLSPSWKLPQIETNCDSDPTVRREHSIHDINQDHEINKKERSNDSNAIINENSMEDDNSFIDSDLTASEVALPRDRDEQILATHTLLLPLFLTERFYSPEFTDSTNTKWRVMWFPKGNEESHIEAEYAACYLEMLSNDNSTNREYYTTVKSEVEFDLSIINQFYPEKSICKTPEVHDFSKSSDWGFKQFCLISEIENEELGFNIDGHIKLQIVLREAYSSLRRPSVSMHLDYDAKEETGMVGLKNQGATCYMNSLLQTLFHLRKLRKAVYDMPTEDCGTTPSVALALQRVFYRLQTSTKSVTTKELTKSFGWGHFESFMQHDVQELNRILCDKLEEKMKKTSVEGTIRNLFEGLIKSFVSCVNVKFTSCREETFYDLQLDVKGCKDIYESFDKYIEVEMLQDENQYEADGYGKQDAEKGMRFIKFPPVLNIHLKRFEYDPLRDGMIKVHDRFEFPDILDLDKYIDKEEIEKQNEKDINYIKEKNKYLLHSVLVHSGDVHGGHYYVFISPEDDEWFMFDDDRITKVSKELAISGNYGGSVQDEVRNEYGKRIRNIIKSFSSAYMLVYVRQSDLPDVMQKIEEQDIPQHLIQRFKKEEELALKKKKDLEEAHLYVMVSLVTDSTIFKFNDYTNHDDFAHFSYEAEKFRVRRECTLKELQETIEQKLHIPILKQRLWTCITRENKTTRVDMPIPISRWNDKVADVADDIAVKPNWKLYLQIIGNDEFEVDDENENENSMNKKLSYSSLVFSSPLENQDFMEEETLEEMKLPREIKESEILLFIKFYNKNKPLDHRLRYVGHLIIHYDSKVEDLLNILIKSKNIKYPKELMLYEEVTPKMVASLSLQNTLQDAELQNGDIICCSYPYELEEQEEQKGFQQEIEKQEEILNEIEKISSNMNENLPQELYEKYVTVDGYFDYLTSKIEVTFRSLHNSEDSFTLNLLLDFNYETIVERVAEYLKVKSCFIGLTQHISCSNGPKNQPLISSESKGKTLHQLLRTFQEKTDILYFEILKFPIEEIERNYQFYISFSTYEEGLEEERICPSKDSREVTVLIEKNACIKDLLNVIHKDQELPSSSVLRLFSIVNYSITKSYLGNRLVSTISTSGRWQPELSLLVEVIPEDELQLIIDKIQYKTIYITHIQYPTPSNSWVSKYGVPFATYIKSGDTLGDLRERIRRRIKFSITAMRRIRLAIVESSNAERLEEEPGDSDQVIIYENPTIMLGKEITIGLECLDRILPPSRYRRIEHGIKISDN